MKSWFDLVFNCFTDERDRFGATASMRWLQDPEKEMLREMRARTLFPAERSQQVPVGTQIIRAWPCRQNTTGSLDCFEFCSFTA